MQASEERDSGNQAPGAPEAETRKRLRRRHSLGLVVSRWAVSRRLAQALGSPARCSHSAGRGMCELRPWHSISNLPSSGGGRLLCWGTLQGWRSSVWLACSLQEVAVYSLSTGRCHLSRQPIDSHPYISLLLTLQKLEFLCRNGPQRAWPPAVSGVVFSILSWEEWCDVLDIFWVSGGFRLALLLCARYCNHITFTAAL